MTLNFAWGTDLNEAADEVRSRIDRVRGRLPEDADPPTVFKFDSTTFPIMGIGLEGDYDRVTLREIAANDLSPRLERVPGVAAVTVDGGLRRQIHVNLSKEKITALDLSVDRVVNIIRTENENIPLGEIDEGDTTYLLRSQGQFENLDEIRDLVVMTKNGVPVYMKDIAEVKDATEDFRSFTRINGKPGVRLRVTKQSGENTVQIADAVKLEVERINREVPGIRLTMLDDQSVFIGRAIDSVKEHAMLGSILVILVIFLFLRDFRSTLIVCTSIPISVIGTFALLYFAGFTLNTMTFGGLALGIGMIVDAAIVVLENTYRHMEMGKAHEQAAIDGSEEVWSAIVASTLTHIAVFIPLLFLTGVSSILFTQLSIVVIFSLSMSLFVAVTLVPVLCAKLAAAAEKGRPSGRGLSGRLFAWSERALEGMDDGYGRLRAPFADASADGPRHRGGAVRRRAAHPADDRLRADAADRRGRSASGRRDGRRHADRARRTTRSIRLEEMIRAGSAGDGCTHHQRGGGGGFMGGAGHRGEVTMRLVPRTERERSNEADRDRAPALARGQLPGVIIRARPSGGNDQMNRILGGGNESRLAVEIRGHDLDGRQAARAGHEGRHGSARPASPTCAWAATRAAPSWRCTSTDRRRRCWA